MTAEEYNRLLALIHNPPPGSAIERAKKMGIDLTLNLRALTLTPLQRIEEMQSFEEFLAPFRKAGQHSVK
jgi:hypothetical protein